MAINSLNCGLGIIRNVCIFNVCTSLTGVIKIQKPNRVHMSWVLDSIRIYQWLPSIVRTGVKCFRLAIVPSCSWLIIQLADCDYPLILRCTCWQWSKCKETHARLFCLELQRVLKMSAFQIYFVHLWLFLFSKRLREFFLVEDYIWPYETANTPTVLQRVLEFSDESLMLPQNLGGKSRKLACLPSGAPIFASKRTVSIFAYFLQRIYFFLIPNLFLNLRFNRFAQTFVISKK